MRADADRPFAVAVVIAALVNVAAATAIVVSWSRAAGLVRVPDQLVWVVVAAVAVVAAIMADAATVIGGRRSLHRRAQSLNRLISQPVAAPAAPATAADADDDTEHIGGGLVIVDIEGANRYHRADCSLVVGKPVRPVTAGMPAGLRACGVCAS